MSNVAAGKDTDDGGESLNDVEKALNAQGIALRSTIGEWRSFEDVLDEIAAKWKNFNDTQRSQIATAIAGKQCCQVPEYIEIYSVMQYKYVA